MNIPGAWESGRGALEDGGPASGSFPNLVAFHSHVTALLMGVGLEFQKVVVALSQGLGGWD